jgi:hypothetical protein
MARLIPSNAKRRQRPAIDRREPIVCMRLARELIERVDKWGAHHKSPSRSEAIRHVLEEGLKREAFDRSNSPMVGFGRLTDFG